MVGENRSDQCSPANERTANKSVFYHQKRAQRASALGCCLSLYCGSNVLLMEDVYTHGGFTTSLQLLCMFTSLYVCILIFLTQIFMLDFLPVINQNRTEPTKNDQNWGWEVTRDGSRPRSPVQMLEHEQATTPTSTPDWENNIILKKISVLSFYMLFCDLYLYTVGFKKTETTIIITFDTD